MKSLICTVVALFALSLPAFSIDILSPNVELGGAYAHISGNQGMNGFNLDAAGFFTRRIAIAFDYDAVWNTSSLGAFVGTSLGQVTSKAHLQDFVIGPRFYFPGLIKSKNKDVRKLAPFVEVQVGGSHLSSSISNATIPIYVSSSDSGFTWELGGGADFKLSRHWVARGKLDLLRTHFVNEGQSRWRLGLGVAYTFRERHL